jgi:hypothetical protein
MYTHNQCIDNDFSETEHKCETSTEQETVTCNI